MRTKDEIMDETRRSCDHYMRHMGLGAYALAPIFVEILCDIRDVLKDLFLLHNGPVSK